MFFNYPKLLPKINIMGEPNVKLDFNLNENRKFQDNDEKELKQQIRETHSEEVIFGLCGPIGTDIKFIAKSFEKLMINDFGYNCIIIKLSDFIRKYSDKKIDYDKLKETKMFEYYSTLIDEGNKLRSTHVNSILAEIAINEIAFHREIEKKKIGEKEYSSMRTCFIIDSIKNIEELELFKLVYGNLFYSIGVFSSMETRIKNLNSLGVKTEQVFEIIDRDSGEPKSSGQKVIDTFVESDLFLRIDKSSYQTIEPKLRRFCNLIFGNEVVTPSSNETAMYLAAASAGNSACLSRQVGASITNKSGKVISVGWNDVPKSGGGLYQFEEMDPTGMNDHRCMNLKGGICFNDEEKDKMTHLIVNELIESELVNEVDREKSFKLLRKSKIKELIEYSRAVHAEMLAIINAGHNSGSEIIGGKLYCTTYPCHNCARHIIAAGISEVYYIEPYSKSLATRLHGDSITEDESKEKLVRILIYEGIAPSRYLEFFKIGSKLRKKNGKKSEYLAKSIYPKNTLSLQAIPVLESKVTADLKKRSLIEA